jgi:hypothetical protein
VNAVAIDKVVTTIAKKTVNVIQNHKIAINKTNHCIAVMEKTVKMD